jgi:hypothetical protein
VHALTQVRIVQGPGRLVERGTVVIRDGIIEAVGASVVPPPDARIWEMDSLTVYPGLIDLAVPVSPADGGKGDGEKAGVEPLGHELEVVTPERVLADALTLEDSDREARRGQGFTTVRALPRGGTFRGQAALVNLGDGSLNRNLLRRSAGQVIAFTGNKGYAYPHSTMGVTAVIRQTFYDTRWYDEAHEVYAAHPVGRERPPTNLALAALSTALAERQPLVLVTGDVLDLLRAGELEREFGISFQFVGSGQEYKRIDEMKRVARSLVIPVSFPETPSVADPGSALDVTLEALRAWDEAPANAVRLHEAGVTFAFTAHGLKDVGSFGKNVGRAIEAGLPPDVALAAVTTVPAGMTGLADRLGSLDAGKIANLTVTEGDLFAEDTKVRAVWIDGDRYPVEEIKPPEGDPRGTWEMVATAAADTYPFTLVLGGEVGSLNAVITLLGREGGADATQSGTSVIVRFDATSFGVPGVIRFSFEVSGDSARGSGQSPDGEGFTLSGTRTAKPAAAGPEHGGSSR